MALLLTLLSPAWGLELDRLDLDALTDELVPQLEQATGRAFVDVPRVHVVSRDELYQRVLDGQLAVRSLMGLGEISAAELAVWQTLTHDAIGFYTYADRQIYLVTTGVEDLFQDFTVPADLERPLVQCVLAHELVHALQHQYQPHPDITDGAQLTVARMMREGHANLVSRPFCTSEAVERFFRFNDGLDILAVQGVGGDIPFLYGYGERYQELLAAEHGTEAAWWSLSQPPPTREVIAGAVEPLLLQGWRDAGVIDAAAQRLMWPGAQGEVQPASPAVLLQQQLGAAGVTALVSTQAGLSFSASTQTKSVTVMAFAFADPVEARRQLEDRRSDLQVGREDGEELFFFGPVGAYSGRFKLKDPRRLTQPVDVAFETRIAIDGGRDYLESWAVRGGLLVAAAAAGTDLSTRDLAEALDLILAQDLPTRPPISAVAGPLGLALPDTFPTPSPSWEYPFLQVFRDINAEQWRACVTGVDQMLPTAPDDARPHVAMVGWTCALASEDPDTATRFLDALDALDDLVPELLIGHAALYSQEKRWKDCLDHIARLQAAGLVLPVHAIDLKLTCLIETRRLSEAAAAARRREGSPLMRVHVSYALLQADRRQQAMPILQEACPKLSGQDRTTCAGVMDQLTPRSR
jgi:hypothetical protein